MQISYCLFIRDDFTYVVKCSEKKPEFNKNCLVTTKFFNTCKSWLDNFKRQHHEIRLLLSSSKTESILLFQNERKTCVRQQFEH